MAAMAAPASAASDVGSECWGQLPAAYAQTGAMGQHASQQETPRVANDGLARAPYEAGVLEDATIRALGVYLDSIDPDLAVEACQ